jgi:hypothetical protein
MHTGNLIQNAVAEVASLHRHQDCHQIIGTT